MHFGIGVRRAHDRLQALEDPDVVGIASVIESGSVAQFPSQLAHLLFYEIPLYSMSQTDYENDDEVREDLVDRLFTVTHPGVLWQLDERSAEMSERARQEGSRRAALGAVPEMLVEESGSLTDDDVDGYWRHLFEAIDDDAPLAYQLLVVQHALGQRGVDRARTRGH